MKPEQARYWYRHIVGLTHRLEAMNAADVNASLIYSAGNEALRRIAQEMLGYTEDVTATSEIPAVDLGEAS